MTWEYKIDYKEYISTIPNFPKRNVDIGPVASLVLRQFIKGPYFSTYQIWNIIKGMGEDYSRAYKDVHKRIQRLHSLGLIEKVAKDEIRTERESMHAPIFYRLTTGGIFNLLYKNRVFTVLPERENIFQHYGNSIIFKVFIYPYFEQSTLLDLKGVYLPRVIFGHLFKCCEITEDTLKLLDKDGGSEIITIPLFDWKNIPGKYEKRIIPIIEDEFGVEFSEEPQITKYNDDKTIKISDKNNSITIQLDDKKKAAILTTNDGRTYELGVMKSANEVTIGIRKGTFKEALLYRLDSRTQYNLLNLGFSIITRITEGDFMEATEYLDGEDFKILSQDPKAMHLLEETNKTFSERYKTFIKLKKKRSSI